MFIWELAPPKQQQFKHNSCWLPQIEVVPSARRWRPALAALTLGDALTAVNL
jgi:hypothetical protein